MLYIKVHPEETHAHIYTKYVIKVEPIDLYLRVAIADAPMRIQEYIYMWPMHARMGQWASEYVMCATLRDCLSPASVTRTRAYIIAPTQKNALHPCGKAVNIVAVPPFVVCCAAGSSAKLIIKKCARVHTGQRPANNGVAQISCWYGMKMVCVASERASGAHRVVPAARILGPHAHVYILNSDAFHIFIVCVRIVSQRKRERDMCWYFRR